MPRNDHWPARFVLLGDLIIDTTTCAVRTRMGEQVACKPMEARVVAALAVDPTGVHRNRIRACWEQAALARGTVTNTISKAQAWAAEKGLLVRQPGRARNEVYTPSWLVQPIWTDDAPWALHSTEDHGSLVEELVSQWGLREDLFPCYLTQYREPLTRMPLLWVNDAFRWFSGWDHPEGTTIQSVIERALRCIDPGHQSTAEDRQAATILEAQERGADLITFGPISMNRSRLFKMEPGWQERPEHQFDLVVQAQFLRSPNGDRTHSVVRYVLYRDGDPGAWWRTAAEFRTRRQ